RFATALLRVKVRLQTAPTFCHLVDQYRSAQILSVSLTLFSGISVLLQKPNTRRQWRHLQQSQWRKPLAFLMEYGKDTYGPPAGKMPPSD
ncbi:MAG TPA: hypothetical protein PL105_18410, partial [Caldilineaceae bacterium]|nr:hypothetical protein [Caldilineaceae bacterium]